MHVVIAGGGSAGHIEPALNTADALRRADPSIGITMLGTEKGLDTKLIPARGYDLRLIPAVPLPRRPTPRLFTVPSRLLGTVKAARQVLDDVQADVVVGFGGYVALPAYLAARKRHVPIVVHEANLKPGLANRVGARFTSHVATGSPGIKMKDATCLGMPLRPTISGLDRAALRAEARQAFGLDPDRPTLFVTGGSQGARRLNQTMEASVEALRAAGIQVLHSYGDKNTLAVEQRPDAPPYVARPYLDRMDLAYAAADFALSRGGMMTCSEFAAVGLPAAYVPLPIGNGEQWLNARPVVDAGGGLLVDDAELTPEWLAENVIPLLVDAKRLAEMSEAALRFGIRDADDRMARLIFEAAGVAWPAAGEGAGAATTSGAASEDEAENAAVVFVADLGGENGGGETGADADDVDGGDALRDAEAAFERFGPSGAADAEPAADAEWLVATDAPVAGGSDGDAPESEPPGPVDVVATASSTEWLVPTEPVEAGTVSTAASAAFPSQGSTMLATAVELETELETEAADQAAPTVAEALIPARAEAAVEPKAPAGSEDAEAKAADAELIAVPKPRSRKKAEPTVEAVAETSTEVAAAVAPKSRTRKKAAPAVDLAADFSDSTAVAVAVEAAAPKPRPRKKAEPAVGTSAEVVVPKPRARKKAEPTVELTAVSAQEASAAVSPVSEVAAEVAADVPAPKPRTRKKAEPATAVASEVAADVAAPKPRTRKKAEPTVGTTAEPSTGIAAAVAPKPRTRKKAEPAVEASAATVSDAAPKPRTRKKAEPAAEAFAEPTPTQETDPR